MSDALTRFAEVWFADFEFGAQTGGCPEPRCLVAREFRTGRLIQMWADELVQLRHAPFSTSPNTLFVAYYSSAELGCFRSLGWPMPARVLDLYCEFRLHTNGLETVAGDSLLGALAHFGLSSIDHVEKAGMRELALRGGYYSNNERQALLEYCQTDVDALVRLLHAMLPTIDLPRALLRGRYMAAQQ